MKRFLIIFSLAAAFFVLKLFYQAGQFKSVENEFNGEVIKIYTNVYGPEDMQIDHETGNLFISSTNRRVEGNDPKNGIYLLNVNDSVDPKKLPSDYPDEFNPHGISLLKKDGNIYLFAVNHNNKGHFIEVFKFQDDRLEHLKSYSHDRMCCPNDVVATDLDKFYVTNDHGSGEGIMRIVEDYLRIPRASIFYYDGNDFIKEAAPFHYANGINISKDGKRLFLTTTTGNALDIFNVEEDGTIIEDHIIDLGSGVDNIDIDEEGNLWIAAHPKLLDYVDHSKDANEHSPSEVFKLTPDGDDFKVELVYSNDGSEISGSSVAIFHQGELFVGVVLEPTILRARLASDD
ncbi:MAG: SMP-30/gluconolactonase/LRE family protein [Bacteroidota bacterium]